MCMQDASFQFTMNDIENLIDYGMNCYCEIIYHDALKKQEALSTVYLCSQVCS